MGQAEAQKFLKMAQEHLERVQVASSDDPTDWPDLTIFGFYCVEAAVMAAAEHVGLQLKKTHPAKVDAAETLARDHGLPDVGDLLVMLNQARKATAYGDIELPPLDAEDLATDIERYVEAVAGLIANKGKDSK